LIGYTAIGNIISKSYYLTLIGQVGCCYSNPKILILTSFLSNLDQPQTEEEIKRPPPDWNPIVADMRVIS